MSARELFWSYRQGWLDGSRRLSAAKEPDKKFTEHPTRPDLTQAYFDGWSDGELAYSNALSAACERYNYNPSPLRQTNEGEDDD